MLFEDKILHTQQMFAGGRVDELFSHDCPYPDSDVVRVSLGDGSVSDRVLIAAGGMTYRALSSMRSLLLEHEVSCTLLVPSRLHPFEIDPLLPTLRGTRAIFVAEDGAAGGTWGDGVAQQIYHLMWDDLRRPVTSMHASGGVIPTAVHLERQVMVNDGTISRTILEVLGG